MATTHAGPRAFGAAGVSLKVVDPQARRGVRACGLQIRRVAPGRGF